MRKLIYIFFGLAITLFGVGAGCGDSSSASKDAEDTPATCADGKDNDNNGATDCKDKSCLVLPICSSGSDSESGSSGHGGIDSSSDSQTGNSNDTNPDTDTKAVLYIQDTGSDSQTSQKPVEYDTEIDPNASFKYDFSGLPFVGVNMSGPEWDGGAVATKWPNQYFTKWYASFLKYFRGWGMTTVRLPFKWEYLQPELNGPLDMEELTRLKTTVFHLRQYRAKILIDMHNYARYDGAIIGSDEVPYTAFGNVWQQLAKIFKPYPEVMFGIMNKPYSAGLTPLPTSQWVQAANTAIAAIRSEGAENLIFVDGNGWSGAHSWNQTSTDGEKDILDRQSNAEAMLQIIDPLGDGHLIFEVHQYLDEGSSDWGTCQCRDTEMKEHADYPTACTNETVGSYRMHPFTQWLKENSKKGFLGEFGVKGDATCIAALNDQLQHIKDNDDVYVGWAWWSAGPGCEQWQSPVDPFCWSEDTLTDLTTNGIDGPSIPAQVKSLVKHLETY